MEGILEAQQRCWLCSTFACTCNSGQLHLQFDPQKCYLAIGEYAYSFFSIQFFIFKLCSKLL